MSMHQPSRLKHVSQQIQDMIAKIMPHATRQARSNASQALNNFMGRHTQTGVIHVKGKGGHTTAKVPIYRRIYNRGHIKRNMGTPKSHKNAGRQYPEYVKWKERSDAKRAREENT